MRVLILGGAGMLGHKAFERLSGRFDVYATFRGPVAEWASHPLFAQALPGRLIGGIDAAQIETVSAAMAEVKPDAMINCVAIVKQRDEAKMAVPSITINALLPHRLAEMCASAGVRLFHISTDCVFSGRKGGYAEEDVPDPVDLYGRSKLLGEVDRPGCLTLRTSIIGWELKGGLGLLEWFAGQRGRTIKGFRNAVFAGFATATLVDLIGDLMESRPDLSGLYQAASAPINKCDLLARMREKLGWEDIRIEPEESFHCDRSLSGARFELAAGWAAPEWDRMIADLAAEWPVYHEWRTHTP